MTAREKLVQLVWDIGSNIRPTHGGLWEPEDKEFAIRLDAFEAEAREAGYKEAKAEEE